jgi:hypothetical protein
MSVPHGEVMSSPWTAAHIEIEFHVACKPADRLEQCLGPSGRGRFGFFAFLL